MVTMMKNSAKKDFWPFCYKQKMKNEQMGASVFYFSLAPTHPLAGVC
jgi:hypothetical protein